MIIDSASRENTVLILAPIGQDGALASQVLTGAGIHSEICLSTDSLVAKLGEVYGALLVAKEALTTEGAASLRHCLSKQPAWSDIPIILLTRGGAVTDNGARVWRDFAAVGNVTLLERPFRTITLVSAAQVALRARRRQYQVRQLLEEQRSATELRDEFISIASHELKNPISALRLQLQLNRKVIEKQQCSSIPTSQVQRLIDTTEQISLQLNRLVDDMLDATRIQVSKLNFEFEDLDLSAELGELVERWAPKLGSTGNTVMLEVAPEIRATVDRVRITQLVTNLMVNAQHYAKGTIVTISLSRKGEKVRLEVKDEGPGIAPENLEKIFDRFERADGEKQAAGLGLGLYISREIVRGHGGTIHAESEPGKGARFVIDLPSSAATKCAGV